MRNETTNDTTPVDSVATVDLRSGVWSTSYRSTVRSRPRIADNPIALAAAGELLNQGVVLELHPDDVMPALQAGLDLAALDRPSDA